MTRSAPATGTMRSPVEAALHDVLDYSTIASDGTTVGVTVHLDTSVATGNKIGEDTLATIEDVIGTPFNDNLYGNDGAQPLERRGRGRQPLW